MSDPLHGELLLGCSNCRRVVAVTFNPARLAQGLSSLDEHRVCHRCGDEMAEATRGNCGHVALPGEECACSPDTSPRRSGRASA